MDHLQAIQAHAKQAYPNECCGLMLGRSDSQGKTLVDLRAVANTWNEQVAEDMGADASLTTARRYWIAPEEMLAAMRDARSRNLEIIGIYHSHPDHPAVPSECDRSNAWPQYSYLIISVKHGEAGEFYSWLLDDQHQFQSEKIVMVESVTL